jgi:hypothetical protein
MHRKNYDQKIIIQFDAAGSFFIDTFYNGLYLKAKDAFANGKTQSLTDAYRGYITQYVRAISSQTEAYMKVVKSLHEYYQTSSRYPSILSEFVDSMVSKFIPSSYYRDFTPNDKDKTLHEIIIKTTAQLGTAILKKEMLTRVIDNHQNRANVTMLQDVVLDIFLLQREEYFSKFTKEIVNENDKVSLDIYNKVKSAVIEETKKRVACEIERDKLVGMVNTLMARHKEMSAECTKCANIADVNANNKAECDQYRQEAERSRQEAERLLREAKVNSERLRQEAEHMLREAKHSRQEAERSRQEAEHILREAKFNSERIEQMSQETKQSEAWTLDVTPTEVDSDQHTEYSEHGDVHAECSDQRTEYSDEPVATYDPWA